MVGNVADSVAGMFSLGNLKTFIPVFRSKTQELSALFDRAIAKDEGVVERESSCPVLAISQVLKDR